jgi:hypothetical protein
MKIKLVRITKHDNEWKGTWYKTGQKHFVVEHRADHLCEAYHAVRLCGGINEADCIELTDFTARLLCWVESLRIKFGWQHNYAAAYC